MRPIILNRCVYVLAAMLFAVHFFFVAIYAVDVPYWDEWEMLVDGGLQQRFDPVWLLARHNEHRIVFTKLQIWLLYRINHWDVATQILMNFILFGGLLASVGWMMRRIDPTTPHPLIGVTMMLMMSAASFQNHAWAFQSQFHLFLLFHVLAVMLLMDDRRQGARLVCGLIGLVCCVYSFSAGVACSAVLAVLAVIFKWRCGRRTHAGLIIAVAVTAIGLWFIGYDGAGGFALTWPHRWRFWEVLVNIVSLGFGYETISTGIGVLCLAAVLAPMVTRRISWPAAALTLGLLAALASIAMGRSVIGVKAAKEASRYVGIAMLLIPFAVVQWRLTLARQPMLRGVVIGGLLLLALIGNWNNWNFDEAYDHYAKRKMAGLRCVGKYYAAVYVLGQSAQPGAPLCRALYDAPLGERFDRAVKLKLSFLKRIEIVGDWGQGRE